VGLLGTAAVSVTGACSGPADTGSSGTPEVDAGRSDVVLPPSAKNGIKDGDETDIDCGGAIALACVGGKGCAKGGDCLSGACNQSVCTGPSPTDGVKNGTETDTDCGGPNAPACGDGKRCTLPTDCVNSSCAGKICQPASPNDKIKNGTETGVDCGGSNIQLPRCTVGGGCAAGTDCDSLVCATQKCQAPTHADGQQNGNETGKDCGGPDADSARCPVAQGCASDADCGGKNCDTATKKCIAPSPTNGKLDGDETAIDCGGAAAPKCAAGKTCKVGSDCASDGCNYKGVCATARSCTIHFGGDTCGTGETGQAGAQNDDCCRTAPVTVGANTVKLDIYKTTAGRMRTFVNAVGGNVRKFIQDTRAAGKMPVGAYMPASFDLYLPVSLNGNQDAGELAHPPYGVGQQPMAGIYTAVNRHLSGFLFDGQILSQQGCRVDAPGTHTYWMDAATQANIAGDAPFAYNSSDPYDSKALNCSGYLMSQAFCIWDGGRLETFEEWQAAWGAGVMPWGAGPEPTGPSSASFFGRRYPNANDASYLPGAGKSIEYATFFYSYEFPNLVGGDYMSFINAPGRLKGRGPAGHADVVGTMMEVTGSHVTMGATPKLTYATWTSNGSFEGHGWSKGVIWNTFTALNKYGKQGLRCAKL
jgi:hypothetical protein